ncbi:MAG: hypothetical protein OER04_10830, partial [Cyclobacteriaceae bacterium]|nr:hypothetical protein [Cyclobacteriaceae bacterium]
MKFKFNHGCSNILFKGIALLFFCAQLQNNASAQSLDSIDPFNTDNAENTQAYVEEIWVHTDKPYYLTGETLWFKAYCTSLPDKQFSNLSKVLYVELISPEGQPVIQVKSLLNSGIGVGQMLLPSQLSTGRYLLRAYTSWMRNRHQKYFFEQQIPVFNPLTELAESNFDAEAANGDLSDLTGDRVPNNESMTGSKVNIITNKEVYTTREAVKVELMSLDGEQDHTTNLSVSVYPYHQALETGPHWFSDGIVDQEDLKSAPPSDMTGYFPETIGPIFYGKIENRDGLSHENNLFVSVGGDAARIYQSVDIDRDNFAVQLSPKIDLQQLYIWSTDYGIPSISINSSFDHRVPSQMSLPLKIDSATIEFIEKQSVNTQISNLYQEYTRIHGVPIPNEYLETPFYGEPEFQYALDEYTRFPSLEEVFIEYVRYVTLRRNKGSITLHVWDEYSNIHSLANNLFFDQPALLMLDGVPVPETQWALDIDVLKIKSIDVVTKKYFIGNRAFHGIINLKTYGGNLAGLELPNGIEQKSYPSLQNQLRFHHPDHSGSTSDNRRIPDRRNTLYWNPMVMLTAATSKGLHFYTGDSSGEYVIV